MLMEEFNNKIYDLIFSHGIGNYLRNQNYKFNVIEAAFIIYENPKIILDDKFKLWVELIENSDDMLLIGYNYPSEFTSMHDTIREYMDISKKFIKLFKYSNNFKWFFSIDNQSIDSYRSDSDKIKNFAEAIDYLKSKKPFDHAEIICMNTLSGRINIHRAYFDSNANIIEFYPSEKELTEHEKLASELFYKTYIELPLPFKKGDIIVNKNPTDIYYGIPIVYEKSCQDIANGRRGANIHDMLLCGYFLNKNDAENRKFITGRNYLDYDFMIKT